MTGMRLSEFDEIYLTTNPGSSGTITGGRSPGRPLREQARPVLEADDQLELLREALRKAGHAGPTDVPELLHLAFLSRCLPGLYDPVNVAVMGPSSSGKSHVVRLMAKFHSGDSVHVLAGTSNRALMHTERKTRHSTFVFTESKTLRALDGTARAFVHELLWGGNATYETTARKSGVGMTTEVYEKRGPTGLILTSIEELPTELATRLLHVDVPDSREQTRAILRSEAARAAGHRNAPPDFDMWKAASGWLELLGETDAVVPFAFDVVERMPDDVTRLRRDVTQVMSLIKTHALAHHLHRDWDSQDRVVAERRDYEAAHRLLEPVFDTTADVVPPKTRATVEAVAKLNADLPADAAPGEGVSFAAVAEALPDIESRSGATRRCKTLIEEGYLRNRAKPQQSARLTVGRPLPEPRRTLPAPEEVFEGT